jgi:hypothetical protein
MTFCGGRNWRSWRCAGLSVSFEKWKNVGGRLVHVDKTLTGHQISQHVTSGRRKTGGKAINCSPAIISECERNATGEELIRGRGLL